MNITKDIIQDLLPLYAANECSNDSRAVVDEYLRLHPLEADTLRRAMSDSAIQVTPKPIDLSEMNTLQCSRKRLQIQSLLIGLAIFLTLAPFAFFHVEGKTHWLFAESPLSASIYFACGAFCWLAYFVVRRNSPLR